jgi:hypothetical protein
MRRWNPHPDAWVSSLQEFLTVKHELVVKASFQAPMRLEAGVLFAGKDDVSREHLLFLSSIIGSTVAISGQAVSWMKGEEDWDEQKTSTHGSCFASVSRTFLRGAIVWLW